MVKTAHATAPAAAARRVLRILAADADPATRDSYKKALAQHGHDVRLVGSARELLDLLPGFAPELVVSDTRLPDADGFELAGAICRERPVAVVLVSASPDPAAFWQAAGCHVLGYLAKPFTAEALGAVVAVAARSFERLRGLEEEVAVTRLALEERKVIERAKGAVMRFTGASEEEAYRRLRRLATDRGQKLADVARSVLAAGEVFYHLTDGAARPAHAE